MANEVARTKADALDAELLTRLLAEAPRDLHELRKALVGESVFTDTDTLRLALQWREDVCELADGVWVHVPTLADGISLTHRLTEEERDLGMLAADRDLDLWARLADEGYPLAAGGEVRAVWGGHAAGPVLSGSTTVLTGPDGWLDRFSPGELVALRLRDGVLDLDKVPPGPLQMASQERDLLVDAATALAEEALRIFEEEGDPLPGMELDHVVLAARRVDPQIFSSPVPPLADMLEASGLEVWRGYVGVANAPWYASPPGLDDAGEATYQSWRRMLDAYRQSSALPGPDELASMAAALGEDGLDVIGTDVCLHPDCAPVVEAMSGAVSGRVSAVPLYLQSRAAEGRGDARDQIALLEAARAADPDLVCVIDDLAELASVRGDALEAHRLYQRAGVHPAYPGFTVLRQFLVAAEGEVGRNRPCPCGSGKKYKACHGRDLRHPLPMRAGWLWTKAVGYALRPRHREVAMSYASILAGPDADEAERMATAVYDGRTHDFALFDEGLLEQFLDELGELLPEDERTLAEQWLVTDRRLLEVVDVQPMRSVRCRDLLTGEEVEIRDRTMTTELEPHDLVYGRPLPDGDGGLGMRDEPVLLPRMMRSRLLQLLRDGAPAEQIASFFAPGGGLPELRTTEGEEVVMCTARYDVSDRAMVWARLEEAGLEATGHGLVRTAEVAGHGNVVQGTVSRSGERLVLESNAVERLRSLQSLLLEVDPGARLVDESTVPLERALAEHDPAADDPAGSASLDDDALAGPEVQEAIAEMMRKHEETWPDVELPALGGLTPRQAAADPATRPDVEALLDDFTWTQRRSHHPTMDVEGLRRALGLN